LATAISLKGCAIAPNKQSKSEYQLLRAIQLSAKTGEAILYGGFTCFFL
jgi:hypothetical protein